VRLEAQRCLRNSSSTDSGKSLRMRILKIIQGSNFLANIHYILRTIIIRDPYLTATKEQFYFTVGSAII
jgi:hypothetical protein